MNCKFLIALAALSLAVVCAANGADQCVKNFYNEPGRFKVCETNPCFVFISEQPFVFLDNEKMKTDNDVQPFKCTDRADYPNLKGPFFELVQRIPALRNASCIWGGPSCTFNGMGYFVGNVSLKSPKMQLITGGQLFLLPYRVSNVTIPSAPFLEGDIQLIGPNNITKLTIREAVQKIVLPFTPYAWWLLAGIVGCFIVIHIVIALTFACPLRIDTFLNNLTEGFLPDRPTSNDEPFRKYPTDGILPECWKPYVKGHDQRVLQMRYLNRVWMLGAKLFFFIVVLFYELAVVDFVLKSKAKGATVDIDHLTKEQLRQFAVVRGSAMSHIFRHFVDHDQKYKSDPPWTKVNNSGELFNLIQDGKRRPIYGISYEVGVRYELRRNNLCNKLVVYKTNVPMHKYATVWYYGRSVPVTTRIAIDHGIAMLREKNQISPFVARIVNADLPSKCGDSQSTIGPLILAVPLAFVIGPFFVYILLFILYIILTRILRGCRRRD